MGESSPRIESVSACAFVVSTIGVGWTERDAHTAGELTPHFFSLSLSELVDFGLHARLVGDLKTDALCFRVTVALIATTIGAWLPLHSL